MTSNIRCCHGDRLTAAQLYALLKLRVDVFVVEQECPYPELDDRDLDPETRHIWTEDAQGPTGYVRILTDDAGYRFGRVATRADARGRGLAGALLKEALRLTGSATTVLDAQSYLCNWYQQMGYQQSGPEFIEDGIPHIPMIKEAS